jgi:predicted DNA-binding protein
LFYVAKEGIVGTQRKRFELRITDEDRQRLRALAEERVTTESAVVRALLRQAKIANDMESEAGKEEAVAA